MENKTRYTLKSVVTGKYIGCLFSDGHADTFNTNDIDDAYSWWDNEAAHRVKNEIGQCVVVVLPLKGE